MSQDVRQWLAEIKSLQQQLAETQQELQAANNSANNWRNLYETEAQQRRTDAAFAQQTFANLQTELQSFRGGLPLEVSSLKTAQPEIQQEVEQIQSIAELREKLTAALLSQQQLREELERLTQTLKQEQADHAQTRKSLTSALGDTIDLLTRERSQRQNNQPGLPTAGSNSPDATLPAPKNPSLELPPLDQAQSPA